jgi:hypothetical protein
MFPANRRSPRFWLLLATLMALLVAACGGGDNEAATTSEASTAVVGREQARPFALGFAAIPASLTDEAYVRTFDTAARHGDAIMIQRAVPWAEMALGAALSADTAATTARERRLLDERDLQLLFAIDPWEPANRGQLAGDAPGSGFSDAAVTQAYLAYVDFVVERYHPRWLALAIDVDQFAQARPDDLDAFEIAYLAAYDRIKAAAPETQVFVTFQLEDLQGLIPWGAAHAPQWSLILRFRPMLDLLAVSSFPSFIFPFAGDVPGEYYARLLAFGKPLALVPVGYASEPARGGVTFGTVAGQQQFLQRILDEAQGGDWELIVWLTQQDPTFASAQPYDLIERMGLLDRSSDSKPAWAVWTASAQRPWVETLPPLLDPEGGEDGEADAATGAEPAPVSG